MARPKKDGVFINYYIDRQVKEMLDKYCEEKGQTNTMAIERILKEYLSNYYAARPDK
jgi:hypothetical protein